MSEEKTGLEMLKEIHERMRKMEEELRKMKEMEEEAKKKVMEEYKPVLDEIKSLQDEKERLRTRITEIDRKIEELKKSLPAEILPTRITTVERATGRGVATKVDEAALLEFLSTPRRVVEVQKQFGYASSGAALARLTSLLNRGKVQRTPEGLWVAV